MPANTIDQLTMRLPRLATLCIAASDWLVALSSGTSSFAIPVACLGGGKVIVGCPAKFLTLT